MHFQLFSVGKPHFLKILSAGYAKDPAITRFNGQRKLYIVHYVLSGTGYFNGSKIHAKQGFLITPNIHESYYPDKNDPWRYVWFIFDDPKTEELFEEFDADKNTHVFSFDNLDVLENFAQMLIQEKRKTANTAVVLEYFLRIFNTQKQKTPNQTTSLSDTYFDFSVNYITSNLHTKITVNQLTELLGISQPRLYTIFKEKIGVSPKRYIDNCKLARAKTLLNETNMTITQIANSIGFTDVLTFSKFFSANEKRSPSNFRKS